MHLDIVSGGSREILGTVAVWPERGAALAISFHTSLATRGRGPERAAEAHALYYAGLGVTADPRQTPGLAKHLEEGLDPTEARLRAALLLARERFVPREGEEVGALVVALATEGVAFSAMGPLPGPVTILHRRGRELAASTTVMKADMLASGVIAVERGDMVFLGLADETRTSLLRSTELDDFAMAARCGEQGMPFVLARVA